MNDWTPEGYFKTQHEHVDLLVRTLASIQDEGDMLGDELSPTGDDFLDEDGELAHDAERVELYAELVKAGYIADGDDVDDESAMQWHDNYALCVDRRITFKLMLTLGGPNSWVEVQVDPDTPRMGIIEAHYHAAWSEYKSFQLGPNDALWQWAENMIRPELEMMEVRY